MEDKRHEMEKNGCVLGAIGRDWEGAGNELPRGKPFASLLPRGRISQRVISKRPSTWQEGESPPLHVAGAGG